MVSYTREVTRMPTEEFYQQLEEFWNEVKNDYDYVPDDPPSPQEIQAMYIAWIRENL